MTHNAHENIVSAICVCELTMGLSYQNNIPWSFLEDRKFFQRYTIYHPIIMGYNTYRTLKAPLPMRNNYVLTSHRDIRDGFDKISLLENAITTLQNPYIIGGAKLYNYALQHNYIDQLLICRLHHKLQADTFLHIPLHNFSEPQVIFHGKSYSIIRFCKKAFL